MIRSLSKRKNSGGFRAVPDRNLFARPFCVLLNLAKVFTCTVVYADLRLSDQIDESASVASDSKLDCSIGSSDRRVARGKRGSILGLSFQALVPQLLPGSPAIVAVGRWLSLPHGWGDSYHHAPTDSASPPDTTCYDVAQDVWPSLPFANPAGASRLFHSVLPCLIDDISSTKIVALAT